MQQNANIEYNFQIIFNIMTPDSKHGLQTNTIERFYLDLFWYYFNYDEKVWGIRMIARQGH